MFEKCTAASNPELERLNRKGLDYSPAGYLDSQIISSSTMKYASRVAYHFQKSKVFVSITFLF